MEDGQGKFGLFDGQAASVPILEQLAHLLGLNVLNFLYYLDQLVRRVGHSVLEEFLNVRLRSSCNAIVMLHD